MSELILNDKKRGLRVTMDGATITIHCTAFAAEERELAAERIGAYVQMLIEITKAQRPALSLELFNAPAN